MKNLVKVVLFAILTVGFFAGFANFGIPRIEPAPPPTEEVVDLSTMTMESFIALGERVFNGKGTCMLCHNEVGGRAPTLGQVTTVAAERIADAGYAGGATNAETYIYESLLEPSAYVVAGFGKAGTQDTESPMPDVRSGSVDLSEVEIDAVVAYLQDLGGVDVTVEIPTEAGEEPTAEEPAAAPPPAPLTDPAAIVAKLACGACHKMPGHEGQIGPDLTAIGATRDRAHLRRSIIDPNAEVAEGFLANMMPPNYGDPLYASELEVLVEFLAGMQ
ncbi:MAG: c-type cytochrome [Gammaproteobacteria bacterium]|nr:c-type cytochrome [Gammaproteobacteria bacterium]